MSRAGRWLARLSPSTPKSQGHEGVRLPPLRQRAFWAVQALTFAIAFAHTVLARLGFPEALYLVPTSLFFIPVVYAALKFGVRGAIPTALWSTILTLPDLVMFHESLDRVGILWQAAILVAIGAFVGLAVDRERAARTDAEAREAARLASERRYRALYDRAADAVLVIDEAGRIGEANAAATRLLRLDHAAVRGRQLSEVVGDDLAADLLSGATEREPRPLHADERASPVWVQPVGTSPLSGPGEGGGLQVMFRDVTLQYERARGLEGYARHAIAAREEERRRMAHELHDGALQSLVLLLRKLDALDEGADEDGVLDDARQIVDETAAELRRLSRALRPPILDDLGLAAALRSETTGYRRRSGIDARFEIAGDVRQLPGDTELLLLRVAQECLHNVERHSQASSVQVSLSYVPGYAVLVVTDDGRGIGPVPTPTDLLAAGKLGLLGMQERVRLAAGTLEIGPRPGGGTMISVRVPAPQA
ncbi:MAG: PAS domain-containing protein [Chloroflexi bacterium]|nr:PAS domain-containing protein [Chloroflexota bacterium]